MKSVNVKTSLRGATANTLINLSYINVHKDNPIECTYVFPLEATTILADFKAKIGDKTINTKVIEKEKAE